MIRAASGSRELPISYGSKSVICVQAATEARAANHALPRSHSLPTKRSLDRSIVTPIFSPGDTPPRRRIVPRSVQPVHGVDRACGRASRGVGGVPTCGARLALIEAEATFATTADLRFTKRALEPKLSHVALSSSDYRTAEGVTEWLKELGVSNAPVPRDGVAVSLEFFRNHLPSLPLEKLSSFLRAMDLSQPVRATTVQTGERLVGFRNKPRDLGALFYARSGASPHTSGIVASGRSIERYRACRPAPALQSYAAGAIDFWTSTNLPARKLTIAPRANSVGVMVAGGGLQLLIPHASRYLEVVT